MRNDPSAGGPSTSLCPVQPFGVRTTDLRAVDRPGGFARPRGPSTTTHLSLLLADCDARWGDYGAALNAPDAAGALQGALPSQYEAKRREWRAAERTA
jgi:hypothetical protein